MSKSAKWLDQTKQGGYCADNPRQMQSSLARVSQFLQPHHVPNIRKRVLRTGWSPSPCHAPRTLWPIRTGGGRVVKWGGHFFLPWRWYRIAAIVDTARSNMAARSFGRALRTTFLTLD